MEKRKVIYGNIEIEYLLTRKKVKNINMRIKPDGKVYVSAGRSVSINIIDGFVQSKGKFILRALEKMKNIEIKALSYTDGEKCSVLGKSCVLKIIQNNSEGVDFSEGIVTVYVKDENNSEKIQKLYMKWQKEQLKKIASEMSVRLYDMYKTYTSFPNLKIRLMKSLWGSCNRRTNTITLNLRLFEYNPKCLLYVLIHEYTHYIHPNHSKEFHKAVEKVMPEWKTYNNMLRGR